MPSNRDVVITGCGVVSPLGVGAEAFTQALIRGDRAVRDLNFGGERSWFGAEVRDFDPKQYIRPRKSLKVMCREIQLAFAAADLAWSEANAAAAEIPPERVGVSFGSEVMYGDPPELVDAARNCVVDGRFQLGRWGKEGFDAVFPLWLLKYLPNMAACHIGIALDARGPNNTLVAADAAGLLSVVEASQVIRRGAADMMVAGGVGGRIHPSLLVMRRGAGMAPRDAGFAAIDACRPFDVRRCGAAPGEGAAAFVLERRDRAEARGAPFLGVLRADGAAFEPPVPDGARDGAAVAAVLRGLLSRSGAAAEVLSHVNAQGWGTASEDLAEGRAIATAAPGTPVAALKGAFGSLGAGAGAVELAASLLLQTQRLAPATSNCDEPDPECQAPILTGRPAAARGDSFIKLSSSRTGQTVGVLVSRD